MDNKKVLERGSKIQFIKSLLSGQTSIEELEVSKIKAEVVLLNEVELTNKLIDFESSKAFELLIREGEILFEKVANGLTDIKRIGKPLSHQELMDEEYVTLTIYKHYKEYGKTTIETAEN